MEKIEKLKYHIGYQKIGDEFFIGGLKEAKAKVARWETILLTKFVFDANVVIGFHDIKYLDIVLKKLKELSNKVYMDENNVRELIRESGYKQKTLLQNSGIFEEISPEKEDFEIFKRDLTKNNIFLSGPDKHVPYIAKKIKADYLITSDQNVLIKTEKIRRLYGIKYMQPMSNVALIHYLYENEKFKFDEYLKVILEYFKYVEMKNIFDAIKNPDRDWELRDIRERFQLYKDPLLDAFKEKIDGAQTKVNMYG